MIDREFLASLKRIGVMLFIVLSFIAVLFFFMAKNAELSFAQQKLRSYALNAKNEEGDTDVEKFKAALVISGIDKTLIYNISYNSDPGTHSADLTVTNLWHVQTYQIRLQMAQNLWKTWAIIHSPKNSDMARIRILDFNGNEVGGSRTWGGSLIWVQEK